MVKGRFLVPHRILLLPLPDVRPHPSASCVQRPIVCFTKSTCTNASCVFNSVKASSFEPALRNTHNLFPRVWHASFLFPLPSVALCFVTTFLRQREMSHSVRNHENKVVRIALSASFTACPCQPSMHCMRVIAIWCGPSPVSPLMQRSPIFGTDQVLMPSTSYPADFSRAVQVGRLQVSPRSQTAFARRT